jgi:hypothetical protein
MLVRVPYRGLGVSGQSAFGQSLLASGQGFAAGGPIGAVVAGVASLIHSWLSRVGPQQNVATTVIVNQAEPLLQQNLAAWNASSKNCNEQATCLAAFDAVWAAVVANCAIPELGDPGHSCIDDRLPAGVEFEYNTFHLVGNGMWNWFAYYRDPIANDPAAASCCIADPCYFPGCVATQHGNCAVAGAAGLLTDGAAGTQIFNPAGGVNWSALLLPALLVGAIWAVS